MILTVKSQSTKSHIVEKGSNLLSALQQHGYLMQAVCGGNGICGKCLVEIEGQGKVLACKTIIDADMTVILQAKDEEYKVLGYVEEQSTENDNLSNEYAVAIDIGTTTLALSLVDTSKKKVLHTYTSTNSQRVYGADVISRIQASNAGKKDELRTRIQEDLCHGIRALSDACQVEVEQISLVVLAGNTTMLHLLMGYSCETLGVYPFIPIKIEEQESSGNIVFGSPDMKHMRVKMLPGISAFVGADIVSGLYANDFWRKEKPCLFIDLGTNGEMAIGTKEKIIVTSVAAGPAFEGGNITHGMGSVKGAICGVTIAGENRILCDTIGDGSPIGICGTGVMETVAELLRTRLIDTSGKLDEEYFEDGFLLAIADDGTDIVMTQKDIREFQLAKAAIRAGVETLISQYGTSYEEIETVYLAGGFGYFMDVKKAVEIGMLPKELREKTVPVGNASLNGGVKCVLQEDANAVCKTLVKISTELLLASDEVFQKKYMQYMMFE